MNNQTQVKEGKQEPSDDVGSPLENPLPHPKLSSPSGKLKQDGFRDKTPSSLVSNFISVENETKDYTQQEDRGSLICEQCLKPLDEHTLQFFSYNEVRASLLYRDNGLLKKCARKFQPKEVKG